MEKLKKDYPQQAASISCEVLEDDELEKRGFGGLVGVGKAAEKVCIVAFVHLLNVYS